MCRNVAFILWWNLLLNIQNAERYVTDWYIHSWQRNYASRWILQFCGRVDNAVFKALHNLVYEGLFLCARMCRNVAFILWWNLLLNIQNAERYVTDWYIHSWQREYASRCQILQFFGRADNAVFKTLHNLVCEGLFFALKCWNVP